MAVPKKEHQSEELKARILAGAHKGGEVVKQLFKEKAEADSEPPESNPPEDIEGQIAYYAEQGAEPEDIAAILGLRERIQTDSAFRTRFDSLVDLGHARLRVKLAERLTSDAMKGKGSVVWNIVLLVAIAAIAFWFFGEGLVFEYFNK